MSADLIALVSTLAAYYAANYTAEVPTLNEAQLATDRWWAPGEAPANPDTAIRETTIQFEDHMIQDLKQRLSKTRINYQKLEGAGFMYGYNHLTLSNWTDYWLNQYDFKEREAVWNKYPAYRTNVNGLDMFYYRIRPQENNTKEVVPLMILHGWPSSPMEYFDGIPKFIAATEDQDFVFDIILPCLPGFGFSQGAARPGFDTLQTAVVLRNLMHRIGYKKFYVQGGDAGGVTFGVMATRFPDEVLGYHTNWGVLLTPVALFLQMIGQIFPSLVVPEKTKSRMYPVETKFNNLIYGTGYMHVQSTQPDTLGISLTDSPIGLLGHLLEKYSGSASLANYVRDDGGLYTSYDPKFLIDTLMFYWSTSSITSSMRRYSEYMNKAYFGIGLEQMPTSVPTWNLAAPEEISYQSPIIFSLKYRNLLGETILDKGGHFIAHQYPEVYVSDVVKAIRVFREWHDASGTNTSAVI